MPKGGYRPGSGRKPKAQSQKLIEQLTPYEDEAVKMLIKALKAGEHWAVKLFFEYRWGKPVARNETTIELENGIPLVSWLEASQVTVTETIAEVNTDD